VVDRTTNPRQRRDHEGSKREPGVSPPVLDARVKLIAHESHAIARWEVVDRYGVFIREPVD
jgi:hypothetical protein